MTVLITLTVAGADSGPFNLFSNLDGYTSAFAVGISKAALLAGYSSSVVPDGTTIVRVVSIGDCTNYIDIVLSSLTTTTTTTVTPTTTTTTTTIACAQYTVATTSGTGQTFTYTDCNGDPQSDTIGGASGFDSRTFCAQLDSVVGTAETTTTYDGPCLP
jgi:hypothetical protein